MNYKELLSNPNIQDAYQTSKYLRELEEGGRWIYGLVIVRSDNPEQPDGNIRDDIKAVLREDARNADEIEFIDFQFVR